MSNATERRLMDRFRQLDPSTPIDTTPEVVDPVDVPEVHRRIVDLLDELLQLALSAKPTGPAAILLRTLHRSRPMLMSDFAKVPEEQVAAFLGALGSRLLDVTDPDAGRDLVRSFGDYMSARYPDEWRTFSDAQTRPALSAVENG